MLTPSRVKAAATMGDEALVPPTTDQAPPVASLQYTATPVSGSATADTSVSMRFVQLASVCQLGLVISALQPLPPLLQAPSAQPRDDVEVVSDVPPTATTPAEVAGYETP